MPACGQKALAVLFALLFGVPLARADYLEIRRNASIKDQPNRGSFVLEEPAVGSFVSLVDDGRQTNGYYRVVSSDAGKHGWIYRTLVRRHRGSLPGGVPVVQPGVSPDPSVVEGGSAMLAHFINVGQGNAALLEFSCGAVLVDAGGFDETTSKRLVDYLRDVFERRSDLNDTINALFVTHTHIDHNRALRNVVDAFKVENYIHNGVLNGSGRYAARWMVQNAAANSVRLRDVSQSEILSLEERVGLSDSAIDPVNCETVDPEIRILAGTYSENPGWSAGAFDNGNNRSLVIRIDFGQSSFLFTGDLEEEAIEELVRFYEGTSMLDVDTYHVGHHGSHNGTTDSLMKSATPVIAILSMGDTSVRAPWTAWRYGHPRKSVIELLDQWIDRPRSVSKWVDVSTGMQRFLRYRMDDAIYGTGWDGDIVATADSAGNFSVRTSGGPGS